MKTILFPTDFSPCADNALQYTLGLCNSLKSKIILHTTVHVNDNKSKISINENYEKKLSSTADEALMKLGKEILQHNNLEVTCIVKSGLAINNIISIAKEKQIDLIIMGTKGASGMHEVMEGSNAAAVLEKSPCPVLIVPDKAKFKTINKIVFATNFLDSDFESLSFLIEIASLFNSEIHIVHVVQVTPSEQVEDDILKSFKDELLQRKNIQYENMSFHILTGGNVEYELEDFIESNAIDLLSLSMRKRTIFTKVFDRSLTKKMTYHTQTPVLAFHA